MAPRAGAGSPPGRAPHLPPVPAGDADGDADADGDPGRGGGPTVAVALSWRWPCRGGVPRNPRSGVAFPSAVSGQFQCAADESTLDYNRRKKSETETRRWRQRHLVDSSEYLPPLNRKKLINQREGEKELNNNKKKMINKLSLLFLPKKNFNKIPPTPFKKKIIR